MNEDQEKLQAQIGEEDAAVSSHDDSDRPETPSRRKLIERYGKYAIVGAPLLLFASKARAIHSRP
jgi:hypothetical protein